MSKRPTYEGVPQHVQDAVSARRTPNTPVPPAAPIAPPPAPKLIETRLKAIEDKLDMIIEILKG